jgi:histidine triad (HIT) family protein
VSPRAPAREPSATPAACAFCAIARRETESAIVFEDSETLAFLDLRPLFPGHCLLIPKAHHRTLMDLPEALLAALFRNSQRLTSAVERAMDAEGSFVAMNNRVSQSVPHFHIHIVPRRKGDGLKGFFWPRHNYRDAAEKKVVSDSIKKALAG